MADTLQQLALDDISFDSFGRTQVSMVVTNPHLDDNPIVYANDAFTLQTGYARSAAIGRNCRFLQGEDTEKAAVDRIRAGVEAQETTSVDILNYRANGEPFMNRLVISPIHDARGKLQYFVAVQKEIREGARGDSAAKVNAQLLEIQNRLEADMSLVVGMIRQQSNTTSVPDEFRALSRRIETLQLLYEEMKLADSQSNRDNIHLGSYISRLACAVGHVYGRCGLRMSLQIEPLDAPIETATRVGLVMSELLTNAFQHAFERIDTGVIEVRLTQLSAGGLRIIIADDGIGIPTNMRWPDPSTVGGRIVSGLIEGLEGTMQLGRGAAGSTITIDVPAGGSFLN